MNVLGCEKMQLNLRDYASKITVAGVTMARVGDHDFQERI